jgi:hypothetical protein
VSSSYGIECIIGDDGITKQVVKLISSCLSSSPSLGPLLKKLTKDFFLEHKRTFKLDKICVSKNSFEV